MRLEPPPLGRERIRPAARRADANRIAHALGHLPLAIEQAGGWLAETGMPADLYLEWLATQTANALGLGKPSDYATPVVATWNLSLDRLRQRSPAAVRLLQMLAFCAPGPISMSLLYSDAMIEHLRPILGSVLLPGVLGAGPHDGDLARGVASGDAFLP